MTRKEIFNNSEIKVFDKYSLSIMHKDFIFSYTQADSVVKAEFKGMYRNFGGLQSNFDTETHDELENKLIEISEKIMTILFAD